MNSFWRSLRYLRPYRLSVAVIIGCVVLIGLLWAGGLGMLLPGAKVLLSDEGVHGYVYQSVVQDRCGMRVVFAGGDADSADAGRTGDAGTGDDTAALRVVSVDAGSPAQAAGIRAGDRIAAVGPDSSGEKSASGAGLSNAQSSLDMLRLLAAGDAQLAVTLSDPAALADPAAGARPRRQAMLSPVPSGRLDRAKLYAVDLLPRPAKYSDRFSLLLWLIGLGMGMTLVRNILRAFQDYLVMVTVQREIIDIRNGAFDRVLRWPLGQLAGRGVADTSSRFLQDAREVGQAHVLLLGSTLLEPAKLAGALAVALAINWQLTCLVLLAGGPTFWLVRRLGQTIRRAGRSVLEGYGKLLAVLEETLHGLRVVKTFNMETLQRKRFLRTNHELFESQRRVSAVDAVVGPAVETLAIAASMVAVALAGYYVLHSGQEVDREKFLVLLGCLAAMFGPARRLAGITTKFQQADSAAARVFELLDSPTESRDPKLPDMPRHKTSIELRNVSFRYPGRDIDALCDVSLTIPAGSVTAIVGPNGSGKTTLASLLPRLIEPTCGQDARDMRDACGQVLIDGRDIRQFTMRSLRRQIALVPQDTVLFNMTAADNIAIGCPDSSRERIIDAARAANADKFLSQLPQGYDTMLGRRGTSLSGGQAQRLAIARAILREGSILIFDEGLSQVDSASEGRIHEALERLRGRWTMLIIAHRRSTIQLADRIVVMDAGRVVDSGTNEELLERCDAYRRLFGRGAISDLAANSESSATLRDKVTS